jgi:hypothetical protein
MPARPLSATQEAETQALAARVQQAMAEEVLEIARLLVSRDTAQLFGPTEFEVRDRVLRVGAQALPSNPPRPTIPGEESSHLPGR